MPRRRRNSGTRRSGSLAVFSPLTITCPRVGRSSSAISLSTVLLPAPERPVRNTISPSAIFEAQLGERFAAVGIALADALEADHVAAPRVPRRSRLRGAVDQRAGKGARIEGAEVLGFLADADEADRQLQRARDRDHDAAARGAIELGEHQAGDAQRGVKLLRLRQRVLALVGIEHQQHFVRRLGQHARDHALDLLELIHQVRLAVQPPGGVGQHHIDAARLRRLQRIEDHRARIGAGLLRAEQRAGAFGPDVQLLDRGGAKGIAGGQHHAPALLAQLRAPACRCWWSCPSR